MYLKKLIVGLFLMAACVTAMEKPEPKFIKVFEEGTQNFVWVPSTLLELALGETFLKMDDYKKGAISMPFNKEVLAILEPSLELVAVAKRSQATIGQIKNLYAAMLRYQPFVGVNTIDLQIQALSLMDYLNVPNGMLKVWIDQIAHSSKGAEIDLSGVSLSDEIKKAINYQVIFEYSPEGSLISYLRKNPKALNTTFININPETNTDFHIELSLSSGEVTNNFGLRIELERQIDFMVHKLRKDFKNNKINFTYSLILNCNFTSLEEDSFPYINKLTQINLSQNELTTVAKNIFKGANNLKYINFYGNELSELPDLSHCPNLEEADLASNEIKTLPGDFLCTQKNIQKIMLDENKISSLPACFLSKADATKLELIDLSNNGLRTLSRELLERFINFAQNHAKINLTENELSINVLEKVPENLREKSDTRGVILIDEYELEPATKKQKTKEND